MLLRKIDTRKWVINKDHLFIAVMVLISVPSIIYVVSTVLQNRAEFKAVEADAQKQAYVTSISSIASRFSLLASAQYGEMILTNRDMSKVFDICSSAKQVVASSDPESAKQYATFFQEAKQTCSEFGEAAPAGSLTYNRYHNAANRLVQTYLNDYLGESSPDRKMKDDNAVSDLSTMADWK